MKDCGPAIATVPGAPVPRPRSSRLRGIGLAALMAVLFCHQAAVGVRPGDARAGAAGRPVPAVASPVTGGADQRGAVAGGTTQAPAPAKDGRHPNPTLAHADPVGPGTGSLALEPGERELPPRSGDAVARAVQRMLFRLERLEPAVAPLEPSLLELELATPEMPFVKVVVSAQPTSPHGADPGPGVPRAVLLVAFGPRFPETAGHLIATWTGGPGGVHLQVVEPSPPRAAVGGAGAGSEPSPAPQASWATGLVEQAWLWPGGDGAPPRLLVVTDHDPAGAGPALAITLLERRHDQWRPVWSLGPKVAAAASLPAARGEAVPGRTGAEGTVLAAGAASSPTDGGEPGAAAAKADQDALDRQQWAARPAVPTGGEGIVRRVEVAPDGTWIRVVAEGRPVPPGRMAAGEAPGGPPGGLAASPAAAATLGAAEPPVLVTAEGPVPARWYQRWTWSPRTGTYVLSAAGPAAQPLSVLRAFITLVSRGDLEQAAGLVERQDPTLVAAGRALLAQEPLGQGWRVEPAAGGGGGGPLVVTRGDGRRVAVAFAEEPGPDGHPAVRISAITALGR